MINAIVNYASKNKWVTILILFLAYLIKYILFRYFVDADTGLTDILCLGAYLSCASAALLLASCTLLTRSAVPSIALLLLTDIWLLANIMYYNANSVLIDWEVILFAGQIKGFESSILTYLEWKQIVFPAITLVTSLCLLMNRTPHKESFLIPWKPLLCFLSCSVLLSTESCLCDALPNHATGDACQTNRFRKQKRLFCLCHSPLTHFGYILYDATKEGIFKIHASMPLTTKEKELMTEIYTNNVVLPSSPKGHLVFVLVESFESWALDAVDYNGIEVTQNLNEYIRRHDVLLTKNVISQQKYGRSGDGQLITQTGLLPLLDGVTCMRFGNNVYPNYAHFYPNSVILDPYRNVWNQRVTTYSYGYKRLRESEKMRSTDSIIFCHAREELEKATLPTCVLAITINTHAPFQSAPPTLSFSNKYTKVESDYLQTVHYMDKHLGRFLNWADTAKIMQNSSIIITADHNHFPVSDNRGRCPLIIKSPTITSTTVIAEAYQMDIFPTVLSVIEQNSYSWHGLGVNLLDSTATRIISVQQANDLSDKLIRCNYFATH